MEGDRCKMMIPESKQMCPKVSKQISEGKFSTVFLRVVLIVNCHDQSHGFTGQGQSLKSKNYRKF